MNPTETLLLAAIMVGSVVFIHAVIPRITDGADRLRLRLPALLLVVAIVVCATLSGCTTGQRLAVLSGGAVALTACDVRQTLAVSHDGHWDQPAPDGNLYREGNPVLGPTPSANVIVGSALLLGAAVAWVATTDELPTWSKYALVGALAAGEGYEVSRMTPMVGICGGRR